MDRQKEPIYYLIDFESAIQISKFQPEDGSRKHTPQFRAPLSKQYKKEKKKAKDEGNYDDEEKGIYSSLFFAIIARLNFPSYV